VANCRAICKAIERGAKTNRCARRECEDKSDAD
jgi:hypothetical protein